MQNQQKAYLFALSAILLWSTVGTAFKLALRYLDFIQLLFFSVLTSLMVLLGIIAVQNKFHLLKNTPRREIFHSALLGLLNPFGYYMVLFKAYSMLPAQIAQPLNYIWPVVLVILSVPLLGQPLTLRSLLAILVSFSGVFLISTQGKISDLQIDQPLGVALAVGSSVIWALFWIFNVKSKADEVIKLFWNFVFGLLFISIAMLLWSSFEIPDIRGVYGFLYVGFFEMGITFVLWLKALQLTSSNDKIGNLVFLSPFLALVFIHLILGEEIYSTTIGGIVLIVSGIALQQLKRRKARN